MWNFLLHDLLRDQTAGKRFVLLAAFTASLLSTVVEAGGREPLRAVASSPSPTPVTLPDARLRELGVNELGRVPVLEWHDITDIEGRWTVSLATLRRQLNDLYYRGYRPVTVAEFAAGAFPIPAGTSPVVLTFDDAFRSHLHFGTDGEPHPDSAVGVLHAFAAERPDWRATAAFYIFWPRPFREAGTVERKLRWLVTNGYEVGNHSFNHDDLSTLDDEGVRRSLAELQRVVAETVGGYRMRSIALPFGQWPAQPELVMAGEYDGTSYRHQVNFLVGDMPALPPGHRDYTPTRVMRVQAFDAEFLKWLDWLDRPGRRFVSDGDPSTLTYPLSVADQAGISPRRVRVYDDAPAS